ncbi:MAG: HAD family hydrolase [Promethearchaeota archaeon]
MKIKALLIDFDGVLVDSTEAYIKATKEAIKEFTSLPVSEEEIREISLEIARRLDLGVPRDKLLDNILSVNLEGSTGFFKVWLKTWNEACLWDAIPFVGVNRTLDILFNRFPLALVTLRYLRKAQIKDQLIRLNLIKYFQTIITTLEVDKPKPHPDSFLVGANNLGVSIVECAVIGDSVLDIRAGKRGGAKTIAVLTGIFDERTLRNEKPDLIVSDFTEIPNHLD